MKRNTVLVALMNNKADFGIAQQQGWYRIPVRSAPSIIKEDRAELLAFYQTKAFAEEKYSVRWYGQIIGAEKVLRKDLLPHDAYHPRAKEQYYKILIGPLKKLHLPIGSVKPRRILFIPTTEFQLFNAKEINYLFNTSHLENLLWQGLVRSNVLAERQYYLPSLRYYLDFALFCKDRNVNVECDGDEYHTKKKDVKRDKNRDNQIQKLGWSTLRFPTERIVEDLENTIDEIKQTVNRNGGLQDIHDPSRFLHMDTGLSDQIELFD